MADENKTPEQVAAEAAVEAAGEAGTWEEYVKAHPETAPLFEARADSLHKALEKEREAAKGATQAKKRVAELEAAEEERKTAEMTELEKERKAREDAEERATKADAHARDMFIRSAFVAEAAKAGAAHPEDVYLLADKSGVEVSDTGSVSGVAEAVKVLVDAGRIPMSGKPPAPNLDGGAGGGERNHMGSVKLTPDEIEMAQKMNVPLERALAQKAALAKEAGAV